VFHSIASPSGNPRLEILGSGEYSFYSTETISSDLIIKTVNLGFSNIYVCNSKDANKVRALFTNIDGESISIANVKNIQAILRKLNYDAVARFCKAGSYRKISQSNIAGHQIIYAYSPRAAAYITDNRQKINLQIAQSSNALIIGWPVILGSF